MIKSLLVLFNLIILLTSQTVFAATTPADQPPELSPQDFIARVTTQNAQVQAALDSTITQLLGSKSNRLNNTPPAPAPELSPEPPAPTPINPIASPPSTGTSSDTGFNMYSN